MINERRSDATHHIEPEPRVEVRSNG